MSSSTDKNILNDIEREIRTEVPTYKMIVKQESKLMLFLNRFVSLFNKTFLNHYITTVYPFVYMPRIVTKQPKIAWQILAHEWIHLNKAKSKNPIIHGFLYLFPQSLTILSLFAIFAIWFGNLWLLNLIWLLCLAPWPAYFRTKEELEAYAMSLYCELLTTKQISKESINYYAKNFYGPGYYYMCWNKKFILNELNAYKNLLEIGYYDIIYPFNEVKRIYQKNKIIR